jgi:hypothetical protein
LIIADANAIAANRGSAELVKSQEANVQMSSGGESGNLWQANLASLRAARTFRAELLRANAVAVVAGLSY